MKRPDALGSAMLQLCSTESAVQAAAIGDCFALGRDDARVMIAIRNSLRSFRGGALEQAIFILSHAVPHPDIAVTAANYVSDRIHKEIAREFVWTQDEVVKLFRAVPWAEGWDRGSLGQCLYHLLLADPDHRIKVGAAIAILARDDVDAAFAALYLTLFWSEKPRDKFDEILESNSALGGHELIGEVRQALDEFGYVTMG